MKKQIEFDFAKWGQEGVIILTVKGNEMLTFHKKPKNDSLFYGVDEYGFLQSGDNTAFKMFEDIKPREFWVISYPHEYSVAHKTEEIAKEFLRENGEIIKVREVLD